MQVVKKLLVTDILSTVCFNVILCRELINHNEKDWLSYAVDKKGLVINGTAWWKN